MHMDREVPMHGLRHIGPLAQHLPVLNIHVCGLLSALTPVKMGHGFKYTVSPLYQNYLYSYILMSRGMNVKHTRVPNSLLEKY